MTPIHLSSTWAAAVFPSFFAGNVLVVDAGGSGSYTQIQPAVDAAADGDTILVRTGSYSGFTIDDKTVYVVADTDAVVDITATVRIENLAADRDALVVGLRVTSPTWTQNPGLLSRMNQGSVRVEDCRLEALGYMGDGANVGSSSDVAFARCRLASGDQIYPGNGLEVGLGASSRVAVYDSDLRGGNSTGALSQNHCARPDGGSGAYVREPSFLFAAGCILYGGDGGHGSMGGTIGCACGSDGGRGGDGVTLLHDSSAALLGNRYFWGEGGPCTGSMQCCTPGGPGQSVQGFYVTFLGAGPRRIYIENPQREQTSFVVEARGAVGDEVYLFSSLRTGFRYVTGYRGVQLVQQPGPPVLLGTIPQGGVLTASLSFPDLGPGVQSRTYYVQAAHLTPQGEWTLGSLVSLVVLDSAF